MSPRKRPGKHTVHTKDPRYNVNQYGRGQGNLVTGKPHTLLHDRLKSRCKNCGLIFYGPTIDYYQKCPGCKKKAGIPYHGPDPVRKSSRREAFQNKQDERRSRSVLGNPEASYNVATGWMSISFDKAPPKDVRDEMKRQGFRYRPRSKTWGAKWTVTREDYAKDLSGKDIDRVNIPRDHAKIAERAQDSADRHREISHDKLDRAHKILGMIPPGQPILVGHHSEKKHRSDLRKVDNLERKGFEEKGVADKFQSKANRHQALATGGENPKTIFNRIKKLESDERNYKSQLANKPDSDYAKRSLENTQGRLKVEREKYKASGGIPSESMDIKVGDRILTNSGSIAQVVKVNKKSVRVAFENPALKSFNLHGGYKVDRQDIRGPAPDE